jgi:hypothetical protein
MLKPFYIFYLATALALSGCGGQLYKVATPPKAAPPSLTPAKSGLVAAARALTGDETMEQFDANLLLAGLVVVDVRLANHTVEPVQLGALRWELNDSSGTIYKLLAPKQALARVMSYYGKRLYQPAAYQQTLEKYETLALPLSTSSNAILAQQEERRGFLFFETKYEATGVSGLTLTIAGQASPISLKLN